ncbi:MAG: TolC family protein [Alphaproteobacteria bacterium]
MQVQAETLQEAVQSALVTHPSVESAQQALKIAKAQKSEEFSGYFPEVFVSAAAGRMYGDNATSRGLSVTRGSGYSNLGEGSITVSQLIFDGLETPNRVEAAEVRKMSAGMNVVNVKESLAFGAVNAYVNVLRSRKALGLIAEHAALVNDYLGRIKVMVEEGASDETELQQARDIQVILNGIKADFEGQVLSAEATFAEVVGYIPPPNLSVPPGMQNLLDEDVSQAVNNALNSHPSILAAQLQTKAASHDVDAQQGTLYPDFNGELSYLKSDKEDILGGEIVDARALVRMSWNFSTGGEQLAAIRRTKHSHKESLARLNELERRIERDVRLAYSELMTSSRQVDLFQQRRALNEKLFAAYQSQFEGARINLLQLMQAHNQLFNTNLELLNGQYRYLAAQYGVLASMGRLQEVMGTVQTP